MIELIGASFGRYQANTTGNCLYEDRLLEPFNLQELSDYVGLSPYHLINHLK